jgi:hypothetical protein
MLSAKEIYERVSAHLLTQRAVSEDENGSCRLRGGDGRKCAIGSLIRDDLYSNDIEGIGMHATARFCERCMRPVSTSTINTLSNF